jgi:hypothetical protein
MSGRVPPHTLRGIQDYVEDHTVFEHELFDAFGRADLENRCDIVSYIYNNVPAICHGSPEVVSKWIAQRREPKNDEVTPDVSISGSGGKGG